MNTRVHALLFRTRVLIFTLLYLAGFLPPWEPAFGATSGTVWLGAATVLAHSGLLGLAHATIAVTFTALICLGAGSALRVWGTAFLGVAAMRGSKLLGDRIITAGPFARLRNPLYLGSWLLALGSSILMPAQGAAFFLLTFTAFCIYLILSEERFLSATAEDAFAGYRKRVPRLLPRLSRGLPSPVRPRWAQALLAEAYPVSFSICFAIFAWRYNARVLVQCLLICFGGSLVVRALMKNDDLPEPAGTAAAE